MNYLMRNGFTLVELSIVLVILGLLVGGVLTGQSLIHAAELRAVTTEYGRYTTAMNTFRDKYNARPGDMPNAVKYWGAMAGGTADGVDSSCTAFISAGVASTGTKTCNGDGDGEIGSVFEEGASMWQHLSNAGLVEGNYQGVLATTTIGGSARYGKLGVTVPASKLSPAAWSINNGYYGNGNGSGNFINALCFGQLIEDGWCSEAPVLRTEDALNLDRKMDDGKPNNGRVRADANVNTDSCVVNDDPTDPGLDYDLAQKGIACGLIIATQ